jgi:integrase
MRCLNSQRKKLPRNPSLATKTAPWSSDLPNRIKLVDTGRFIPVDLEEMVLEGDGGTRVLRLAECADLLCSSLFLDYSYTILHALNGRRKASTVKRWSNEFSLFLRSLSFRVSEPITMITFEMFNFYCSQKQASQQKLLRSFLLYWSGQKRAGLSPDLTDYLAASKAPRPRSTIEIQNACEHERPFSVSEVRSILAAIDALYVSNKFDAQDNLLWRLIVSEAMRPSQLGLLQVGDVRFEDHPDTRTVRAILSVPVVKQKATPARRYMMQSRLSEPVTQAMRQHLALLRSLHEEDLPLSHPLFCVVEQRNGKKTLQKSAISITHRISVTRTMIAGEADDRQDSELFTRRFKHTKLTHLAVLGAPKEVLARAGFQTSTISLRHYVNLTEEAFAEYEHSMSETNAEILGAFQGEVIDKANAMHPGSEHEIFGPQLDGTVGACSANPCDVFAPVGCYVCPRFEAFTDGAHQSVLDFLLAKKRHLEDIGLPHESVQRDNHLIAAVQQVIREIEESKRNA